MSDDGQAPGRRARRPGLLAVVLVALLVGAVGGYALRAATEPLPAPPAPPSAQATPAAPAPAPAPAPCAAVADLAERMTVQLERAAQAMAALDPGALRAIVDEVERLHAQLTPSAEACRAEAER